MPEIRPGHIARIVALLAVLAAVFLINAPAFAQDELPPAEPPAAAEPPAEPPAEAPAEEPALVETLESLAGAGLTPSEGGGEPLPLASEDGPSILANQACYTVGGSESCFASVTLALNNITTTNTLPSDRKIYLQDGTLAGFTLNGTASILSQINGVIGAGSASTTVTSAITVQNVGSFTLQGMTVNAGVTFSNNTGKITVKDVKVKNTAGNGISASGASTTAFEMTDSVASGSSQRGLFLDFSTGTTSVTILRSTFNLNGTGGIRVNTLGSVTLNQVTAVDNNGTVDVATGHGAFINGGSKPITVTTSEFGRNFRTGLIVQSTGAVTLRNVSANRNDVYGAWISSFGSDKGDLLVQSSNFNDNGSGGLLSTGTGAITLNGVSANSNNTNAGSFGVRLNNTSGIKGISILDTLGANSFNGNGSDGGLEVKTKGSITASGVSAISNAGKGAVFENYTGTGKITLNRGTFIDNSNSGVELVSARAISVRTITARGNTNYGARLDNNSGPLNQSISVIQGVFTNNAGTGLQVNGRGSVLLDTIDASSNTGASGFGAELNNTFGAPGKSLTLTNVVFNDNDEGGILAVIGGAITVTNIQANSNNDPVNGYGAKLDNSAFSGNVTVKSTAGPNEFSMNAGNGLWVLSSGAVTISNASFLDNDKGGLVVENFTGTGNVTLTNLSASDNVLAGMRVNSLGAIKGTRLNAYDNGVDGVNFKNDSDPGVIKPITISGSDFNNNNSGAVLYANGAVTVLNTSARENNLRGIYIDAFFNSLVVVRATNSGGDISHNNGNGLFIYDAGKTTLQGLTIEDNGSNGIFFDLIAGGPVSLINTLITGNGSTGATIKPMAPSPSIRSPLLGTTAVDWCSTTAPSCPAQPSPSAAAPAI